MTVKQKVTYAVSYDSSTDILSTKLNTILNNIVALIRTNNPELLEVNRITYGSSQMTDAPLYDTDGSGIISSFNQGHFESDVVFIGTDSDNITLSLGFYGGRLVISMNMDPSVEQLYADNWQELTGLNPTSKKPIYVTGKNARYYADRSYNGYSVNLAYKIIDKSIQYDVVYWTGDYTSGYMFYNGARETNGVDLVIYKTYENLSGTTSLGGALWRSSNVTDSYAFNKYTQSSTNYDYGQLLLAWSFEENLSTFVESLAVSSSSTTTNNILSESSSSPSISNSKFNMRKWYRIVTGNSGSSAYHNNSLYTNDASMMTLHTLGGVRGDIQYNSGVMPVIESVTATNPSDANFVSPLLTAYNLPYLGSDECYLRKLHIPGFNKYCKGEIYLMYSPSITPYETGDIITVDNMQFAVINRGIVCYVARVN